MESFDATTEWKTIEDQMFMEQRNMIECKRTVDTQLAIMRTIARQCRHQRISKERMDAATSILYMSEEEVVLTSQVADVSWKTTTEDP